MQLLSARPTTETPLLSSDAPPTRRERESAEVREFAQSIMKVSREALRKMSTTLDGDLSQYQECFAHLCGVAETQSSVPVSDDADVSMLCTMYRDDERVDAEVRDHLGRLGETLLLAESLRRFLDSS